MECEWRLMGTAGLFGLLLPALASSADVKVRAEIHSLGTVTLSAQQALLGGKNGKPAMVAGELRIPTTPPSGRFPAVVLLHGGNGLTMSEEWWAQEFNSIGVAVFLLDSFTGRGVTPGDEQAEMATLTMMVDGYRALGMLARHARIDPGRIAVMGFSMGAAAALYAGNERFRRMYAPPDIQFAAHIGLYTPCYWSFHDDDVVTSKPIRLFHGIADDWVPIGPCRAYVERLRKAGADITLTEYPDAYHGYDSLQQPEPKWLPQAISLRDCKLVESEHGVILEGNTGKSFDVTSDPCRRKGVHVGYNEAAATATIKAVKEVLIAALRLKP